MRPRVTASCVCVGGGGGRLPGDGGLVGGVGEAAGDGLVELGLALAVAPRREVVLLPRLAL